MKEAILTLAFAACLLTGCSNTSVGAGVGTGNGVSRGGIGIGSEASLSGDPTNLDEQDREKLQQRSPSTLDRIDNGQPLSIDDIKKMSKAGLKDHVINRQIDATHSTYELSSDDIIDLKKSGVSQKVIHHMVQTTKP